MHSTNFELFLITTQLSETDMLQVAQKQNEKTEVWSV